MSVNVFFEKTPKNFSCEICDFISFKYSDYSRHILTAKHIKNAKNQCLSIKNAEKAQPIFCCEKCDYNTSNKFDFDKHLSTDKHIVNVLAEKPKKAPNMFVKLVTRNILYIILIININYVVKIPNQKLN
jgi:hypothetical protein